MRFLAEYLTDAPDYRSVTQSIFVDLFKKGDIVEDLRPNIYDPVEGTTIADAEVEQLPARPNSWMFVGPARTEPNSSSQPRPELICACGVVVVHPDDERYTSSSDSKYIFRLTPMAGPPASKSDSIHP